ncbi:MAG: 4-hydroxy-tetrahydrodipicolinate synthase [Firmicutes bacterium]|nr:4-hydroxy-tetrahydrodipicolinate synthase [Bacillota bacterium]MCL1954002.1 4-hydroxy-tetrahydrodipicolinate synthase [Bacillota bacterium]
MNIKNNIFQGTCTALITPFDESNKVDIRLFEKQIDFQIDNGIDALLVLGTTGEPSTINDDEYTLITKTAVKHVAKRVPLLCGISSNNTAKAIQLSKTAQHCGVDALLITTPYYNKCTQNGIIAHFNAISNNVSLPIVAYNVPNRTSVNIDTNTAVLLSQIPNIVAIKEASSNLVQITDIIHKTDSDFCVYSGDDILALATMSIGAKGIISVISNAYPKTISQLTKACIENNYPLALDLHYKLLSLLHAMYIETNPIGIKTLMKIMRLDSGKLRLPLTPMEENNIQNLLYEYKILEKTIVC